MIYDHETGLAHESASTHFQSVTFIEWLFISHAAPLTGEQYGKMEPKYLEGGHCQSVSRPQEVLKLPPIFGINYLETTAIFNKYHKPTNMKYLFYS